MPSQALAWPNAIWLNKKGAAIESTCAVNAPVYTLWRVPASLLGVSADYLAPVPEMGFTYQYYPVVKGQRLVASAEAEDPDDKAIRYLGISLPREWRRMGIPGSHLGVDPRWLRNSRGRFQHEPDYTQEYHQKANLVRLYLDDLAGQGTIQFWDRASRTYQPIEDEMTFTTHPSSLTWVWPQRGGLR